MVNIAILDVMAEPSSLDKSKRAAMCLASGAWPSLA